MSRSQPTLGALFAILVITAPAKAESTRDAVIAFGLTGTWSLDCASDVPNEDGSQVTFKAPLFGALTVTDVWRSNGAAWHTEWEVKSAERVTEDKMVIIEELVSGEELIPPRRKAARIGPIKNVIVKIGKKIRFGEAQFQPLFEKCLNR